MAQNPQSYFWNKQMKWEILDTPRMGRRLHELHFLRKFMLENRISDLWLIFGDDKFMEIIPRGIL